MKIKTHNKTLMPSLYLVLTLSLLLQSTICDVDLGTAPSGTFRKITCSGVGFGLSLTALPDVNGDSIADFAVGMIRYTSYRGAVAIVYGSATQSDLDVCGSAFDTTQGYIITGEDGAYDRSEFGKSLVYLGNINTGVPTIAVSASGYQSYSGRVYFINLPNPPASKLFRVTDLTNPVTQQGSYYTFTGGPGYEFGNYLAAIGDVNGDGKPDAIVSVGSYSNSAQALLQGTNLVTGDVLISDSSPMYFQRLVGSAGSSLGQGIVGMGNLYDSQTIAYMIGSSALKGVYLLKGTNTGNPISGSDITLPGSGVTFTSSTYKIGGILASGDIDGDGIPDAIIGASSDHIVYVLNGTYLKATTGTNNIDTIASPQGIRVTCADTSSIYFGRNAIAAVDVNGDGVKDILISDINGASNKGVVYVIYGGKSLAGVSTIEVTTMTSDQGFKYIGSAGLKLGSSAAGNRDFDGVNGIPDLLLGAPSSDAIYFISNKLCVNTNTRYISGSTCLPCSSNCATCTSALSCQSCATSFVSANGFCCDSNNYFDGSTCQACSANCASCTSSTSCQTCTGSFALTNSFCCASGQTYTSGRCVSSDSNLNSNPSPNPISSSSPSSDFVGLSAGQLAGIIIGSVLGAAAIISLLFLVLTKTALGAKILPNFAAKALGVKGISGKNTHIPVPPTPTIEARVTIGENQI